MSKAYTCIVCKKQFAVDAFLEYDLFVEIDKQANALGIDSLTENEQCVVERLVCGEDCYYNLP